MSYDLQRQLASDGPFTGRTDSCCVEQAHIFKDDARPQFVALANEIMRNSGAYVSNFTRLGAAGPGVADKADNGDGTINSDNVTDADILALTQANWPVVAGLFYNEDGSPVT